MSHTRMRLGETTITILWRTQGVGSYRKYSSVSSSARVGISDSFSTGLCKYELRLNVLQHIYLFIYLFINKEIPLHIYYYQDYD